MTWRRGCLRAGGAGRGGVLSAGAAVGGDTGGAAAASGAGAVAAGGIISLFRSLPVIWSGLKGGLADLRRSGTGSNDNAPRTLIVVQAPL